MASADTPNRYSARQAFMDVGPGRLMGRGHPAGDHLEAYDWVVLEEEPGRLVVDAHLPDHLLNPRRQLFGGYTPTYVDLISLHAARAGPSRLDPSGPRFGMATVNMRIDYYEPVLGPRFRIEADLTHQRGRTCLVTTRLLQDDVLAVHAITTLRHLNGDG